MLVVAWKIGEGGKPNMAHLLAYLAGLPDYGFPLHAPNSYTLPKSIDNALPPSSEGRQVAASLGVEEHKKVSAYM